VKVEYIPENTTQQDVNYSSDNEAVVSVDASGKITAIEPGIANIFATSSVNSMITKSTEIVVIPTIMQARQLSENTPVELRGIVNYKESNKNFHLQDSTAGIKVLYNNSGVNVDEIGKGSDVHVTGKMNKYNELVLESVKVISQDNQLTPKELTIKELNETNHDSQLVSIKEAVLDLDNPSSANNYKLIQGDDVLTLFHLPVGSDLKTGDIVNVEGTMGRFSNKAQILGSSATITKVGESELPEPPVEPEQPETPEDSELITIVSEGFDGYLTDMPFGWSEENTKLKRPNYSNNNICGVMAPCVKLENNNQIFKTPTFELSAEGNLSFFTKGNGSNNV
ncbi:MAG: Ig-like domain-containing protein, partial [Turicibacter sp.]